jgi:predicted phage gp36 major capsid-like protein
MTDNTDFETKADGSVGAAFEEFMRAFEAYKDTNDERLAELERRSASDPLIDDKLARLDRALDETKRVADRLAIKAQRPHLGAVGARRRAGDGGRARAPPCLRRLREEG